MKKRYLITTLMVIACFLFLTLEANAKITGGVGLSYGTANHKYLGVDLDSNKQWSSGLWANLTHEDLLITSLYQRIVALGDSKIETDLMQIAANYRFYNEEFMQIYGGLGYQLFNTKIKHSALDDHLFSLTGHGFVGQVIMDIIITENLHAVTKITGNPWQSWFFSQDGYGTSNIDKSPAFSYGLGLHYDLVGDFAIDLGLLGGSYKVSSFDDKGESRNSHTGITLSISRKF